LQLLDSRRDPLRIVSGEAEQDAVCV